MTSISSLANKIMRQYDHNHDGKISLHHRHSWDKEENSRTETRTQRGYSHDTIITTKYSHHNLFDKADRNNDKEVTRHELKEYMRRYDTDHNGRLDHHKHGGSHGNRSELSHFNSENRETSRVISRRTVPNWRDPWNPGHGGGHTWPPHHGGGHHRRPGFYFSISAGSAGVKIHK